MNAIGPVFLAAGLAYGLVFVFATPPFQVPDEPAHFCRAYAVSEGTLSAQSLASASR